MMSRRQMGRPGMLDSEGACDRNLAQTSALEWEKHWTWCQKIWVELLGLLISGREEQVCQLV